MADQPGLKVNGSNALLLAGIAALALAVFFVFVREQGPSEAPSAVAAEQAEEIAPESDDIAQSEEAPIEETAGQEDVAANNGPASEETVEEDVVQAEPEAAPAPVAPTFDLVRIDPTGGAVIAGSAEPGASVRLMAGGEVVGEAVTDASGKFVALFDLPPSSEPRSLSAEIDGAEGTVIASSGTVLIAPTARPAPVEVAKAEPEASATEDADNEVVADTESAPEQSTELEVAGDLEAEELASEDAPIETAAVADPQTEEVKEDSTETARVEPTPEAPTEVEVAEIEPTVDAAEEEPAEQLAEVAAPEPVEVAEADPVAPEVVEDSPAIVLADESGVKVLQPAPQPVAPKLADDETVEQVANLVIDTITYDDEGEVALSGRGAGESFARVYVDDTAIKTVPIKPDGTWDAPLPEINAGVYNLRIDEVDSEGAVTSRVETPFKRETPEVVAEAAARPNAVTVQKGFTLWAIARERFGDGTQYVRVYEANRDLIRDPDLIYPGQIFEIPEG